MPVHPVKIYSASGVAVIVIVDPDSNEPPVLSIEPPAEDEALTLKKTVGTSVSCSKASFVQVISIIIDNMPNKIFFIIPIRYEKLHKLNIKN